MALPDRFTALVAEAARATPDAYPTSGPEQGNQLQFTSSTANVACGLSAAGTAQCWQIVSASATFNSASASASCKGPGVPDPNVSINGIVVVQACYVDGGRPSFTAPELPVGRALAPGPVVCLSSNDGVWCGGVSGPVAGHGFRQKDTVIDTW